jgi:hypothetical protein
MSCRAALLSAAAVTVAAVVTLHGAGVSRQEADSLSRKITVIAEQGSVVRPGSQGRSGPAVAQRRTMVSESELNSWFAFKAPAYLPPGVTRPTVTMLANGDMKGAAVVDLDAVAKQRRGGVLDPFSFLGGQLPVTLIGKLSTKDGLGRFEMQSGEIAGVPVPSALLEEVIAYYSRSSDASERIRLGESFALPANIRQIEVSRGQMVVVQ